MVTATRNGTVSGSMPDAPPPFPTLAEPTPAQRQREYAVGGGWGFYGSKTARTLPHPIDDITSDFGDDLYDRMMFDPQIAACVTVVKASVLETGPAITSPIVDQNHAEFELSKEITDQCIRMLADLTTSFADVLWNLLDSVAFGNKVAEKVYGEAASIKTGKRIYVLEKLKVKPRHSTLFAVDAYLNLAGILVAYPPNAEPVAGTAIFTSGNGQPYGLISPSKFVISQFRVKDSDPRGTSILRPGYAPWWRKQQVIPEYLKYLAQFAGPSLVGIAPPEAQPQVDPANPDQTISATEALKQALEQFRNMTVIAVPNGGEVKPINMQGDGAAFRMAISEANEEITKGILTQSLATEEGQHMARAAATVHQDVLDTLIRQIKLSVQDMIRNQVFRPWVRINWGENVEHLAPIADLGATEQRDKPGLWQGAAALANSKFFTEDQLQALDAMLGLPIRQKITALAFQLPPPKAGGTSSQPPTPTDPNKIPVRPHERNKPQRTPLPGQKPVGEGEFETEEHADDELQAA